MTAIIDNELHISDLLKSPFTGVPRIIVIPYVDSAEIPSYYGAQRTFMYKEELLLDLNEVHRQMDVSDFWTNILPISPADVGHDVFSEPVHPCAHENLWVAFINVGDNFREPSISRLAKGILTIASFGSELWQLNNCSDRFKYQILVSMDNYGLSEYFKVTTFHYFNKLLVNDPCDIDFYIQ